jgi:hypothetical protein
MKDIKKTLGVALNHFQEPFLNSLSKSSIKEPFE